MKWGDGKVTRWQKTRLVLLSAVIWGGFCAYSDEPGVLRFWHNDGDVANGHLDGIEDRENFFHGERRV